ncbi:MAG: hypothetical protein ACFB21_14600 [Opitutales bacterium]
MDHFFNELGQIDRYQIIAQRPDGETQVIHSKYPFQAFAVGQSFGYGKSSGSREGFKIEHVHREITDTPDGLVDSITLVLEPAK